MAEKAAVRSLVAVIRGRVQGLGFRPFVYRLARRLGVTGTVSNSARGVVIVTQGPHARRLIDELRARPPRLARISSTETSVVSLPRLDGFRIVGSEPGTTGGVEVLPDLATCPACRRELLDPEDRRFGYAFTNCTQCGPRYTIIERLPYDRPNTTMRTFRMCPTCRAEYENPGDRRFHAQPNACPACGPRLALFGPAAGNPKRTRTGAVAVSPLSVAARAILAGKTVAIKSLGGFQLACDATNNKAVRRLRRRKDRPRKPLALMCGSVATAARLCLVTAAARRLLESPAAPIVLMPKLTVPGIAIAGLIAPGNNLLGIMLAYAPLHIALFEELARLGQRDAILVMTSANRRDEPIVATDDELRSELDGVYELALTHDRPIANRADDSVLLAGPGRSSAAVPIRRARGLAPDPVELAPMFHVKHPILAVGAEWKNCFALAAGSRAYLSPHIGTVAGERGEAFFRATLERYRRWTGIRPQAIACDLHPDYLSTRLAERLSREFRVPLVRVQHHYAHVLSVLAEHGARGPVLGLACDGTGYGTDGAIWGCEFLLVRPDLSWTRVGHLDYLRLAGAGNEVADPTAVGRAYLAQARGRTAGRGPETSSLGRLFDAVAGITGICRRATFDGEPAIVLESACEPGECAHWFRAGLLDTAVSPARIDTRELVRLVSRETSAGTKPGVVAARFHNTLCRALGRLTITLAARYGTSAVVLSGGSFQNRRLLGGISNMLRNNRLCVITNSSVPPNDGGIALGQIVAAAAATRGRARVS